MPGVVISTAVRTGPTGNTVRETSQAFFVGLAQRGPTDEAIKINSQEEYEAQYGGYVSYGYLHDTVQAFFEEGGTQCYIARVVGPGATTGFLTIQDDDPQGTGALDSITITANGAGAWSTDITVLVTAGITAGTRTMLIYNDGDVIYSTGDVATPAAMAGKINSDAIASNYVTAEAIGENLPEVTAPATPVALSAGNDDQANITTTEHNAALNLFLDSLGAGVVANPESSADAVKFALIDHANANNRIAYLFEASGTLMESTVVDDITDKARAITAARENTEHAQLIFPWVYKPTATAGVTRLCPPVGYAAGARARAHNQIGPQQVGAGIISSARFITGLEYNINKTQGDRLDDARVVALRRINNAIRIYGARTLSADTSNFRYITGQDVVNHVVVEANRALEDLLFSTIDGRNNIFASVEAKMIAILEPLRLAGALYEAFDSNGKRIDYGYTVKCDASLNPVTQLADGLVKAKVGVRVSSVGDKIEVDIVKSNLTASVV